MMTLQQKNEIVDLLKLYKCFGVQYMEPLRFSKENLKVNNLLPNTYEKLNEYIQHCNLCELSKGCLKSIGKNDPNSTFYIVGLNYNFHDNFMENQSKNIFESILGIDFNKVYMTNIIKCETQGVNFHTHEAALKCEEYIFQEIIIGKPKYIFATVPACRYILKNQAIDNSSVGNYYKVGETMVFPIFDFDFISKNPSYKDEMERAFIKIKGLIN